MSEKPATAAPTPVDVTPSQLAGVIDACAAARVPVMVWGNAGLGKSRISEQRAKHQQRQYFDFRLLTKDMPDLAGFVITSSMRPGHAPEFTAPADLPPSGDSGRYMLVLEELSSAPRMLAAAAYGLVLERRLNSYHLPADTAIVATGNPAAAGGVYQAMPRPLANRFCHVRLVCTPSEHLQHAIAAGWHPLVPAWHEFTKGTEWDTFDPASKEDAFASPRAWQMVSDLLNAGGLALDIIRPMMAGLVGSAAGGRFAAFLALYDKLAPTLDQMATDPAGCPIPRDPAAQWFLAACVAEQWTLADAWPIPLLRRLNQEVAVFTVNAAYRRSPAITSTPEFRALAADADFRALSRFLSN